MRSIGINGSCWEEDARCSWGLPRPQVVLGGGGTARGNLRDGLQINPGRPLGGIVFQPFWFLCVDVIFPSVALLTSAPHTDQDPHRERCASEVVDGGRDIGGGPSLFLSQCELLNSGRRL